MHQLASEPLRDPFTWQKGTIRGFWNEDERWRLVWSRGVLGADASCEFALGRLLTAGGPGN